MIAWHCLVCKESGETTGTESGADAKHVKATTHATTSQTAEWAEVICGYRETYPSGTDECVAAPGHDGNHYMIRLAQTHQEPA